MYLVKDALFNERNASLKNFNNTHGIRRGSFLLVYCVLGHLWYIFAFMVGDVVLDNLLRKSEDFSTSSTLDGWGVITVCGLLGLNGRRLLTFRNKKFAI